MRDGNVIGCLVFKQWGGGRSVNTRGREVYCEGGRDGRKGGRGGVPRAQGDTRNIGAHVASWTPGTPVVVFNGTHYVMRSLHHSPLLQLQLAV